MTAGNQPSVKPTDEELTPVIGRAAGRGQNGRRVVHLARRDGFSWLPVCGARADYGYSPDHTAGYRPCPRCEARR